MSIIIKRITSPHIIEFELVPDPLGSEEPNKPREPLGSGDPKNPTFPLAGGLDKNPTGEVMLKEFVPSRLKLNTMLFQIEGKYVPKGAYILIHPAPGFV